MEMMIDLIDYEIISKFLQTWLKENWLIQVIVLQSGICLISGRYLKRFVAINLHDMESLTLKYSLFICFYALFVVVASVFMMQGLIWVLMILPFLQRAFVIVAAIIAISILALFQSMKWLDEKHCEAKKKNKAKEDKK